jgi:hypothetical protein
MAAPAAKMVPKVHRITAAGIVGTKTGEEHAQILLGSYPSLLSASPFPVCPHTYTTAVMNYCKDEDQSASSFQLSLRFKFV